MASQEKISVHSLADLKNTSDDAIPNYLNSISFTQSHTLSDVRLALGYTAFAICAATFYWDYKLGFDDTKYYTAAAVAVYTLLNGALTFWIWGVEKGKVYVGHYKDGRKIEISTATKKHVPTYNLTITTHTPSSPKPHVKTLSKPFTEWFDVAGHFIAAPFQEMLAVNSAIIGEADPKRVAAAQAKIFAKREEAKEQRKKQRHAADDGKSMDEKWMALLAESGDGVVLGEEEGKSTATPSKGGKRRGKKA